MSGATAGGESKKNNGITVFSGGTAANGLVDVFNGIAERRKCQLNYVIPISDNGGSSSELIRFVGGPSVGDIRSRLVRLIPNHEGDEERAALKALFEFRLCSDPTKARAEWLDIVEARHLLWTFVSSPKRELIRSVLNTLNLEIVKRARPTSVFNFAEASIGNMFLTGARLFSGSFESAIYLLSMICSIPDWVTVLPAINSNFTHHISAGLADGTTITGQVAISHPSAPTSLPDDMPSPIVASAGGKAAAAAAATTLLAPPPPRATTALGGGRRRSGLPWATTAPPTAAEFDDRVEVEDANLPGSLPALRRRHIAFSKEDEADLPARIARLWYINPYGHEIWPVPNPKVIAALRGSRCVVYSVGSLWTSIVPSLVLHGVGEAISEEMVDDEEEEGDDVFTDTQPARKTKKTEKRKKVLILNSRLDRETGPSADPMTARDFVLAIARAAAGVGASCETTTATANTAGGGNTGEGNIEKGDEEERELVSRYVTHLVYLEGEGAPAVRVAELGALGVRCVRVAARRIGEGRRAALRYDEAELGRALEAIMDE